jgi:hypothetical protein
MNAGLGKERSIKRMVEDKLRKIDEPPKPIMFLGSLKMNKNFRLGIMHVTRAIIQIALIQITLFLARQKKIAKMLSTGKEEGTPQNSYGRRKCIAETVMNTQQTIP